MRRFRILTRLASQKPYTMQYLEEVLGSLGNQISIRNMANDYKIAINSSFEKQGQVSDLEYIVRTVVPANLITEIDNKLQLNNLRNQMRLSASLTIAEMVVITQDFKKSNNIKGTASIALGMTNAENNNVTADFVATNRVSTEASMAIGQMQTQYSNITQDFNIVQTASIKSKNTAGIVSAEFVEINKESENLGI